MTSKTCSRCKETKFLTEFHRSKWYRDGHISRCKTCEAAIYQENKEKVRARQKKHWAIYSVEQEEKIREKNRLYRPLNPEQRAERLEKYYRENKLKRHAQYAVHRAIRKGILKRQACEICGAERAHAHHDDYSKPLEVRFLCQRHHSAWHVEHGEAPNGKVQTLETEEII